MFSDPIAHLVLQLSAVSLMLVIIFHLTRHRLSRFKKLKEGHSFNRGIRRIIGIFAIAGITIGFLFSYMEEGRQTREIHSNLSNTARIIATGLDYRAVPTFNFSEADLQNPRYLLTSQQLEYISDAFNGLTIRTFAKRDSHIVTGPTSIGAGNPMPGTPCHEPTPLLENLFLKGRYLGDVSLTLESEGRLLGYAPLYNPRLSLPSLIVGVDLPMDDIKPAIHNAKCIPLVLLNIFLVILLFSIPLFPRKQERQRRKEWYRSPEAIFAFVICLFLAFLLSRGSILSEDRFRNAILEETTSAQSIQIDSYLKFHERRFINLANQIYHHPTLTESYFYQMVEMLTNKDFVLSTGIAALEDSPVYSQPRITHLKHFFPEPESLLQLSAPFPEVFDADQMLSQKGVIGFTGPFNLKDFDHPLILVFAPIPNQIGNNQTRFLFLLINPDLILREAVTLQGSERAVFEVQLSRLGVGGKEDVIATYNLDEEFELAPGFYDPGYPAVTFGEALLLKFKPGPGFYNRYQEIAAPISIPLSLFLTILITYFVGFFSTRRYKLEEEVEKRKRELDQSEHRFYRLFNSMSEAFGLYSAIRDADGKMINYRVIEVNQAYVDIVGIPRESIVGLLVTDVYRVPTPPFIEKFNEMLINQHPIKFEGYHAPLRKHLDVSVTPWDKDGFATLFSDASPRLAWEKALRESEEKYRLLIENQQDFIIKVDLEGRYLYASPSFLTNFGLTEAEIIGNIFIPKISVEDFNNSMAALNNLKKPPYRVRFEQRVHTTSGWRWIAWNNSAILEAGVPVAYIGVGRDISWRKQYEQELEEHQVKLQQQNREFALLNEEYQSLNEELASTNEELMKAIERGKESDNLKTAFLQNISHEIRTPLNAIIGFSEMLTLPNFSSTEKDAFANLIINSSRQLLSLVNDVMTISTLETQQEKLLIGKVNLQILLQELHAIFAPQANEKGVELIISEPNHANPLLLETDELKLTQVFNNLIGNAIKFTHNGNVTFGYEDAGEGFIRCFVKDTGIGIPKKFLTKIFERFRQATPEIQAQYGGTGLGLAISKGHVELMGGKIWVESATGKGSSFFFELPLNLGQNS